MFKEFLFTMAKAPNGEKVRLIKTSNRSLSEREGQIFMLQRLRIGDNASLSGFERGGLNDRVMDANRAISTGPVTKIHDAGKRILLETEQSTYLFERVSPEEF